MVKKKKRSSSAKPRSQTERERNYQMDGGRTESIMMHEDAEMRAGPSIHTQPLSESLCSDAMLRHSVPSRDGDVLEL